MARKLLESQFSPYDSDRAHFSVSDRPLFRWKMIKMGDRTKSNLEYGDDCVLSLNHGEQDFQLISEMYQSGRLR